MLWNGSRWVTCFSRWLSPPFTLLNTRPSYPRSVPTPVCCGFVGCYSAGRFRPQCFFHGLTNNNCVPCSLPPSVSGWCPCRSAVAGRTLQQQRPQGLHTLLPGWHIWSNAGAQRVARCCSGSSMRRCLRCCARCFGAVEMLRKLVLICSAQFLCVAGRKHWWLVFLQLQQSDKIDSHRSMLFDSLSPPRLPTCRFPWLA